MEKENKSKLLARPLKRPLDQVTRGPPTRFSVAPPSRRPIAPPPSTMICDLCQRMGHLQKNCRWANGQCLACGSGDHQLADCPIKGQKSTIPTLPAVIPRSRNTYLIAYSVFRSYFSIYFPYLTDFNFKYHFPI